MLTYSKTNYYSSEAVSKSAEAIVTLDLNETQFMLGMLADITMHAPTVYISNHSFYKSYIS